MIWQMALSLAHHRGVDASWPEADLSRKPDPLKNELLVLGHGRIVEEIARIACLVKWPLRVYGLHLDRSHYPDTVILEEAEAGYADLTIKAFSSVIVASHHRGDHTFIQKALAADATYIGMIASHKRAGIVRDHLQMAATEGLDRLRSPAGLPLACKTPQEIALSCIAEIIALKNAWLPPQNAENPLAYPSPKERWDAVPRIHNAPHGF
jgi:xanthine/CO dehydrogenase XdhC/CoxF family maturation factor